MNLNTRLDSSQILAISVALNKSLTLIHAPSNTGKIATLIEIVKAWLELTTSKILVVSESNLKVDMLHMALLKGGVKSLRLDTNPDENKSELVNEEFREAVGEMQDAKTHVNAFHIKFQTIKRYITDSDVIVCTLDALASEYLTGFTFPRVIIDEASSSLEPAILGAFTKNCQHAVLFGDHKVLPPKCTSDLAASKGLKISLFER